MAPIEERCPHMRRAAGASLLLFLPFVIWTEQPPTPLRPRRLLGGDVGGDVGVLDFEYLKRDRCPETEPYNVPRPKPYKQFKKCIEKGMLDIDINKRRNVGGDGICLTRDETIYDVRLKDEEADVGDLDESTDVAQLPMGIEEWRNRTAQLEFGDNQGEIKYKHDLHIYKAPYPLVKPPKSGYIKKIIREGWGPYAQIGQGATLHMTGFGKDGNINQKFWSSKDGGDSVKPFETEIGTRQVLTAIDECLLTMRVGEKACVVAAPDVAYGKEGFPDWNVPGNSPVKFEIELIELEGGYLLVMDPRHQLRKKKEWRWKLRAPLGPRPRAIRAGPKHAIWE